MRLLIVLFALLSVVYAQYAFIETFISNDCSGDALSGSGTNVTPGTSCVNGCNQAGAFSVRTTCSSSARGAPSGTIGYYLFSTDQCTERVTSGVYMIFSKVGCTRAVYGSSSTLKTCNSTHITSKTCSDSNCQSCSTLETVTRVGVCSPDSSQHFQYVACGTASQYQLLPNVLFISIVVAILWC